MNIPFARSERLGVCVAGWISLLLLSQPILDALSFWLGKMNHGEWVTLGLRMLLLAVTLILAFALSEKKRIYWITCGILILFWLCHAFICQRIGYQAPAADFINFARVAQIPLLALSLTTLLRNLPHPEHLLDRLLAWSLYLICAITLIAVLSGTTVYSYDKWNVGYSGWFALPNCQSAVYGVLTTLSVFAALEKKKALPAILRCLAGFLLLFFLGTRLAYAEIFLIAAASIISMIMTHRFDVRSAAAIILLAALCAAFYSQSPMAVNRRLYQESVETQQAAADEAALSTEALYEKYMSAMVDRFGMDAVKEVYQNSRDISVIGDVRLYKINYCKMVMAELPPVSRWFGFELAQTWHQNSIFDVENDYHGIYFLYGILGLTMLLAYLAYYAIQALIGIFKAESESRRFFLLAASVSAVILLINAGFSASVLRRPNASIYLSLTLAIIWVLTEHRERRPA